MTHIKENIKKDKYFYSLDVIDNIERCKVDADYFNDCVIANENLIWHAIHKNNGNPDRLARMYGFDKNDIFQLGSLGFLKALKSFDPTRKLKFSSYAVTAIYREIRCYIRDTDNILRLSRGAYFLKKDIKYANKVLGTDLSIAELSVILDRPATDINKIKTVGENVLYVDELNNFNIEDNLNIETYVIDKISLKHKLTKLVNFKDEYGRYYLNDLDISILKAFLIGTPRPEIVEICNTSKMAISRSVQKLKILWGHINICLNYS